jgi:pyridoxal phosphate enzyme (YggS family)
MGAISAGLQDCRERIVQACRSAARPPNSVRLLAVSKTFPAEAVREAYRAGQRLFGESYLQEALPKLAALADLDLEWHFIGPIQSNKARPVAEHFAWAHAVDRLKIAQRLSDARPAGLPPLNVCIQVNVSGEATKHGVQPAEALNLARAIGGLPGLRLRGFMCIPRPAETLETQREPFRKLSALLDRARAAGLDLDTLSMGMSDDLEAAILEGATLVRVGTAIFGKRQYNKEEATP